MLREHHDPALPGRPGLPLPFGARLTAFGALLTALFWAPVRAEASPAASASPPPATPEPGSVQVPAPQAPSAAANARARARHEAAVAGRPYRSGFWGVSVAPEDTAGASATGLAARTLGLRGHAGATRAGPERAVGSGLALRERAFGVMAVAPGARQRRYLLGRYADTLRLGGDGEGLDYLAEMELAVGARFMWTEFQGPLARLGLRAHAGSELGIRDTGVRAPELQLGYSWIRGKLTFDLAAHGSYSVVGRYRPRGYRRSTDGDLATGAYLAASWGPVWLDAEWSRLVGSNGRSGAYDELRGELCAALDGFAVCAEAQSRWVDVRSATVAVLHRSVIMGLSVAVGTVAPLE